MKKTENIKSYYFSRCKDNAWYQKYYQCGKEGNGTVFKCFNTNYRNLSSFKYYFCEFKKYVNLPRNEWEKKEKTGQEIAKQYVSNLTQSRLFMGQRNEQNVLQYNLTLRGEKFQKMLEAGFSENEEKFLTFLFILNASFCFTPKYILRQAKLVWQKWLESGFEEERIKDEIEKFFKEQKDEKNVSKIFEYEIVWLLSFYSDKNFLSLYKIAEKSEIKSLQEKTVNDYNKNKKENVLAYKFKNTNLQKPALLDTLTIIYVSKILFEASQNIFGFAEFFEKLAKEFENLFLINKNKIFDFINNNKDVFEIIYKNALSEEDDFTENIIPPQKFVNKEIQKIPNQKIDDTSKEGIEKLSVVRQVLKRLAKEKSHYKCALESLNSCKYFTSKEDERNYLEIHHFVPREFSCDFDETIEFEENYIPLCPLCHRLLHKAVDRERQCLITFLFNQKNSALKEHGINIELKTIYRYYKIDS